MKIFNTIFSTQLELGTNTLGKVQVTLVLNFRHVMLTTQLPWPSVARTGGHGPVVTARTSSSDVGVSNALCGQTL